MLRPSGLNSENDLAGGVRCIRDSWRIASARGSVRVIGGIAGNLLGSDILTNDLDICFARDLQNTR
jgi:hypothetical protein